MGCSLCHFSTVYVCACHIYVIRILFLLSQVDILTHTCVCALIDIYLENWNMCGTKLTFIQIKYKWTPSTHLYARYDSCSCCCCCYRCHCRQRRLRHRHYIYTSNIICLPAVVVSPITIDRKMVKIYAFMFVNIELKWFMWYIEDVNRRRSNTHTYGNQIKHSYFQE